jgi:phage protein U
VAVLGLVSLRHAACGQVVCSLVLPGKAWWTGPRDECCLLPGVLMSPSGGHHSVQGLRHPSVVVNDASLVAPLHMQCAMYIADCQEVRQSAALVPLLHFTLLFT